MHIFYQYTYVPAVIVTSNMNDIMRRSFLQPVQFPSRL